MGLTFFVGAVFAAALDLTMGSRADMESAPTVLFVMFIVFALGVAVRQVLLPGDS